MAVLRLRFLWGA